MIKVRAVWGDQGRDLWLDVREIAAVEQVDYGEPERPVTEVTLKGGARLLVDMAAGTFVATHLTPMRVYDGMIVTLPAEVRDD